MAIIKRDYSLASPKEAAKIRVIQSTNTGALSLGENVRGRVTTAGGSTSAVLMGAGSTTTPVASTTAGVSFIDWRTACSATSGTSYGVRAQHKVTGAAGSGAAVRAYAFSYDVAAANVYGVEASAEYHSTGASVSGLMAGIKANIIANVDATGTPAVLDLSYNVASGKTVEGVVSSFIRVSNSGSGTGCTRLLALPAVANGSVIAAHTAQTNTHSIKIDAGGVTYYIPCHATATGRS